MLGGLMTTVRGLARNKTVEPTRRHLAIAEGKELKSCPMYGFMFCGSRYEYMMDLESNGCALQGEFSMAPCLRCGEAVDWRTCTYCGQDQAEHVLAELGDHTKLHPKAITGNDGEDITLREWDEFLQTRPDNK